MLTIQNLEVRFEVEGDGDEAVFSRLFAHHIREWRRSAGEEVARRKQQEKDRALGDSSAHEDGG